MIVDPVPVIVAGLAIAWLFAHAAWHKLRALQDFTAILGSYRLLPGALLRPAAIVLVALECAIAAGAVVRAPVALIGATGLLGAYAIAIAINLYRDRALLDCGCGGPPQPISWWLVLRNLALIGAAAFAHLPTTDRALGPLDAVTIAGALLLVGSVYATANTLHAARAQLEEWV